MNLLIIDPHQLSRDALCHIVGAGDDIDILANTADYETSVSALCQHEIDIVIIVVADTAGIGEPTAAVADFKQIRPGIRILVVAGSSELVDALQLLGAGADGYITRQDDSTTLVSAIHSIAGGARYVCPAVGWHLAVDLLKASADTVLH
jgi:DNA-binding NarL/FixJ family response regulator